jgi:hypothetical protein
MPRQKPSHSASPLENDFSRYAQRLNVTVVLGGQTVLYGFLNRV